MNKLNSKNNTILVVDDDTSVTASLALFLKRKGFDVIQAHSVEDALLQCETNDIDLVLQDMNFSRATTGEEGLSLLTEIKQRTPSLPVILMTAWGSIALAVEGMRLGAADFIAKPWDENALLKSIATAIGLRLNVQHDLLSREKLDQQFDFSRIIGESPQLVACLNTIARVCKTDASVLILGESGTGKELMADAIHRNSRRHQENLVKVNLGGIPPSLFESDMFGHVKGAFTDAKQDRVGRFEQANRGTLFLDEIGELDKSSQVKLLRVLQDQIFQKVGTSQNTSVDVRIVSATNKNLESMVQLDDFREDLFYRINLITITLPSLSERLTDIPLLVHNHLNRISQMYGIEEARVTPQALHWLQQQQWPGNIRQLCQTIERVLLMSGKSTLEIEDFLSSQGSLKPNSNELDFEGVTLGEMEKLMIERSLQAYNGNISKVAEALGLSRAALYRRLEKHGLSS